MIQNGTRRVARLIAEHRQQMPVRRQLFQTFAGTRIKHGFIQHVLGVKLFIERQRFVHIDVRALQRTLDQRANAVADKTLDNFHAERRQSVMRPHQVDAGRQISPCVGERSVQIKDE